MVVLWACLCSCGALSNYPNVAAGAPSIIAVGDPSSSGTSRWTHFLHGLRPVLFQRVALIPVPQWTGALLLHRGHWEGFEGWTASQRNLVMVEEAEPGEGGLCLF